MLAGLEIARGVARLNDPAQRRFGVSISVRVGVHRGLVYSDTAHNHVYGLAANLAARVSGLAPPGIVGRFRRGRAAGTDTIRVAGTARRPRSKASMGSIAHHQGDRAAGGAASRAPAVGVGRAAIAQRARWHKVWARARAGTLTTAGIVFRGGSPESARPG